MIDIDELRRLAQAATPGPWHATKSVETNSWAVWSDTTRLMELRPTKTVDMYQVSNTAAFIAAANPAAITELLDRIETAEKERDFAKAEIARLHDDTHKLTDERDAQEQRRVVCAANREPADGVLIVGARHWDFLMHIQASHWPLCNFIQQGFIDQHGVFMDRREAWQVAEAAGQIIRRVGGDDADGGTLYSENLY